MFIGLVFDLLHQGRYGDFIAALQNSKEVAAAHAGVGVTYSPRYYPRMRLFSMCFDCALVVGLAAAFVYTLINGFELYALAPLVIGALQSVVAYRSYQAFLASRGR